MKRDFYLDVYKWKENRHIAYWKYEVNDFYDRLNCFAFRWGWSLINAIKLEPMVYQISLKLIPLLIRNFCQKSHKTFLEVPMVSHLANRKWSCYLESWDRSGINNHLVRFWSRLKLSPEKWSTDAQHFLYLVDSGLRRNFASHAIVFLAKWYWQLDFTWTNTEVLHSKSNWVEFICH